MVKFDCNDLDYSNIQDCLEKVLGLLDCASSIMARAINVPSAGDDDLVNKEFWKRPYIDEATDVFSKVFGAQKFTKKMLDKINEIL